MTASAGTRTPRVFSIPPGAPFLETLGDALLDGTLIEGFSRAAGPLGLAAATIYVPTRRSARALAAILADRLGAPAALLPRIVPLGALDDTELLFEDGGLEDALAPDLPLAIGDIARRMILTRLILRWGEAVRHAVVSVDADGRRRVREDELLLVATAPADAWHLSGELARLIDELVIEDVPWTRVEPLGTDAFDDYWRITLDFLDVAVTRYPLILAEMGIVDGATRQVGLIAAQVARLAADRAAGPVVVAGSTGTNKATARLIAAVSRLPRGAVVLPGLDTGLDETAWQAVGERHEGEGEGEAAAPEPAAGHPQAALRHLLRSVGIGRDAVTILGEVPRGRAARDRLVSEALRPADTTDRWAALDLDAAALEGVTLIDAADEREEALAAALALREALEGPGTAALVTPDRELARRVREELVRWDIDIEASGGEPLGQTEAGALARLTVDCALRDLGPIEVLALLHHPALRLGRSRSDVTRLAQRLELAILRGVLPARSLREPGAILAAARDARERRDAPAGLRRLTDADLAELERFLEDVLAALAPLRALVGTLPLPEWLAAHETALAALVLDETGGATPDGSGFGVLGDLLEELDAAADPAIRLDCADYAALFERLAAEMPVRGPARAHPRLKILGLLEARLLSVDRIVLGGLDEGIWPPAARTDPFLNRPMRAALGLSPPERRIGRTAHDFAMALGHAEVIVTRAIRRSGAPSVPSRFVQRLEAVAGEAWAACRTRGARYLALARALDRPQAVKPVRRPAPKPDVALRPKALSVTRIEVLRRDPYAIYAERILRLRPSEPISAIMGLREFGTFFHGVIGEFSRDHGHDALPAHAPDDLSARLERAFATSLADASFRSFGWPRVQGWGRAFLSWHEARRREVARLVVEERGELMLRLADGSTFTLTATADRIELDGSGAATIVDFKTGTPPGKNEVLVGFAPQLTLEAVMAAEGAFPTLGAVRALAGALYVKFGGGETVKSVPLDWRGDPPFAEVVATHRKELVALLESFADPATGYIARPFPKYASRFGTYDHLARVKEWSATGDAEEGGEPT